MQTPFSSRIARAPGTVGVKAARRRTSPARSKPGVDAAAVCGNPARGHALRCLPSARLKIVKRAIRLAGDARYPSSATIEGVALLLADQILASAQRN